jgi:hypothetical protein
MHVHVHLVFKGHQIHLEDLFIYGVQRKIESFCLSTSYAFYITKYGPYIRELFPPKVGRSIFFKKKLSKHISYNQIVKHCWPVSTYLIIDMNWTRDEQISWIKHSFMCVVKNFLKIML